MRNFFKYPLWFVQSSNGLYWGVAACVMVSGPVDAMMSKRPGVMSRANGLRAGRYPAIFSKLKVAPTSLLSTYVSSRSAPVLPVKNLYFTSTNIDIDVTNNLQGSSVTGSTIGTVTLNTPLPWKGQSAAQST